jgi:NAD(P)-dependent dehydrogenase (short-subunit alcohol dehydrogenase family)
MRPVALVTGAANGIGLATLELLHSGGWSVAGVDRDREALDAARSRHSDAKDEILLIQQDLSDQSRLPDLFQRVLSEFGRVDALINCAAILGGTLSLLDIDIDEWDQVYSVNLRTPFVLMKLFASHAVSRGGGGRIVNVTSASAFRAMNTKPAYGSSKAALGALTRILAAQLGAYDINVNAVAPGVTNTPGAGRNRNIDLSMMEAKVASGPQENFFHRVTESDDVAATIQFLCGRGSRQITGQTIHVSAGAVTP